MGRTITLAVGKDFMTDCWNLPRQVQGKVNAFLTKFAADPDHPGINFERLNGTGSQKIYSGRIDNTYRIIIFWDDSSQTYILLRAAHHDEAYDWVKDRRIAVNPQTGVLQLFDMAAGEEAPPEIAGDTMLFDKVADRQLLELGLPREQLPFVRSIRDNFDFRQRSVCLPEDVRGLLSFLADGESLEDVMVLAGEMRGETPRPEDIAGALENPETRGPFAAVAGEEEMRQMLDMPLEDWRIFLHPIQRRAVDRDFSGPALVVGSAGTGKTVVAMHRAKRLAAGLRDGERILLTTYTSNLVGDLERNLKKICTPQEFGRIVVANLDSWVAQYLYRSEGKRQLVYGPQLRKLWEEAAERADPGHTFPAAFYEEEWNRVIAAQGVSTLEEYRRVSRTGRGSPLAQEGRELVWRVTEAYQSAAREWNQMDVESAMALVRQAALENPELRFRHVIVDEAQDFSPGAFRLLRALAGEERRNDLFIVGDVHQRIYDHRVSLAGCGVNIRGRSVSLWVNYRTTEEIQSYALGRLEDVDLEGLDGGRAADGRCYSLTRGGEPVKLAFKSSAEETEAIYEQIRALADHGVPLSSICVTARTNRLTGVYREFLAGKGLPVYEIKSGSADDQDRDGVRVATMHRIKGLEFQYVFVAGAARDVIPLSAAIDNASKASRAESIGREKCLLYVALTRARRGAYISGVAPLSELL